jgi:hypothetical protein
VEGPAVSSPVKNLSSSSIKPNLDKFDFQPSLRDWTRSQLTRPVLGFSRVSLRGLVSHAGPGGIPVGETRDTFYGFLCLFCVELLSENISALQPTEEHVLSRNSAVLKKGPGNKVKPLHLSAALS